MSDSLDGRTLLITGAANGIGRAIAELAAERGARTVLVDLDEAPLTELANRIGGEGHVMDVGDAKAWQILAQRTGQWDYLFLNAGIMSAPPDAPLEDSDFLDLDLERYRRILSVNIDGVAFGLRTAIPRMRASGGGIVVTASVAGVIGYPLDPAYALTKHAVIGLIRSLAPTLPSARGAPTLRLTAICPGGVGTDLVPKALRKFAALMDPAVIAWEALDLAVSGANGEMRAKVKSDEPAQVLHAPEIALV